MPAHEPAAERHATLRATRGCPTNSARSSPYREVLFLAVDAGLADTAAPQRPAGLGRRFASIHFDVATALARTSSGTAIPLSRAIASAKDSCAALGALVPAAPVLAVTPAARSGRVPVQELSANGGRLRVARGRLDTFAFGDRRGKPLHRRRRRAILAAVAA